MKTKQGFTMAALQTGMAVPFLYFGTQLAAALFFPGYSFLRMPASLLGSDQATYPMIFNAGAILTGLATLLAAVGIFGVMSYAVTLRTREIGLRMALGAQPGEVLRLILKQGLFLTAIGIAIGLAGALALTRVMSGLLFGVGSTDPATYAAIVLVLALVSLLACYLPARRAMRVDPLIALRYD